LIYLNLEKIVRFDLVLIKLHLIGLVILFLVYVLHILQLDAWLLMLLRTVSIGSGTPAESNAGPTFGLKSLILSGGTSTISALSATVSF